MKGGFVAYHMRPNKAIERHLFVDLLTRLNRCFPIHDYTYIGFGGTYFEDFKLVHSYFGNQSMISIESDTEVYERQKFNVPHSCIDPRKATSSEFINSYTPTGNSVIWLDFAAAASKYRRGQLDEFAQLVTKADEKDIIKITINANPNTLFDAKNHPEGKPYTLEELNEKRFAVLKDKIGDYFPSKPQEPGPDHLTPQNFPILLSNIIRTVASRATADRLDRVVFHPLTCFTYADSEHQMMTLTGIVIKEEQIEYLISEGHFGNWPFTCTWGECHKIFVPFLTVKEKSMIDQYMPCTDSTQVERLLSFKFSKSDEENRNYLEGYYKYYRYYPSYHKINF